MAQRYQISDTGIEDLEFSLRELRKASRSADAHEMLKVLKDMRSELARIQDDTEKTLWKTEPTHVFEYEQARGLKDSFTFHGTNSAAKKLAAEMRTGNFYSRNIVIRKVDVEGTVGDIIYDARRK